MIVREIKEGGIEKAKALFDKVRARSQFLGHWSSERLDEGFVGREIYGAWSVEQEELLGLVLLQALPDGLEIHMIAIAPEHERRGVGRKLIDFLKNKLESGNGVYLEVEAQNLNAVNFYRSQGFETDAERKNYYGSGRHALVMSYRSS